MILCLRPKEEAECHGEQCEHIHIITEDEVQFNNECYNVTKEASNLDNVT